MMESDGQESAAHEPWRTLHPASLWVNLVPQIWRTIRVLWPVLLAGLFTGGDTGAALWFDLVLLFVFFGLGLIRSVVHWATLRYRMEEGRLAIKSGLIHRTSRVIDPQRIQNMEQVQNLFHKMAGLAELRIETAGDRSTEGLLSAIHIHEAEALQSALKGAALPESPPDESSVPSPVIAAQSLTELIAYGISSRGIGAIAILGVVAIEVMGILGPEFALQQTSGLDHIGVLLALLMLAFSASFTLSVVRALHNHWNFRLTKEEGRLITTEGLTTRRRVEIPLRKIQLVRTEEPILRRVMGFGTLHIETAGLGFIEGEAPRAEGVIPMVEQPEFTSLIRSAVPDIHIDPWAMKLQPAHFRALLRSVGLACLRTVVLVAISSPFLGLWSLALFGWLLLSLPATWLDWRKQGWAVDAQTIVSRRGFFNRRTWLIPREKLQSVSIDQTPGMQLHGLAQVLVRVAGAQIAMPEIAVDQAQAIFRELQRTPSAAH